MKATPSLSAAALGLLPLAPLAVGLLIGPAHADTIFRADGKPIEDCTIVKGGLKVVTYKEAGDKDRTTIATDKVVRIEFEKLPKLVDRAEDAFSQGEIDAALGDIEEYLDAVLEKGDRRFAWGPAYALHRQIAMKGSLGDLAGVVKTADKLIQAAPDSMYLMSAYLAKASALADLGKQSQARSTLRDFQAVVESKGLSRRWELEAELALVMVDPDLKAKEKREKLITVADTAGGEYPTVKSRADLATAEAYLEAREFDAAQALLEETIAARRADDATMAGAYTGLGDCLFQTAVGFFKSGDGAKAEQLLQEALLAYMRVVVTYNDQSRYVAKSMFFAGRVFDQYQEDDAKRRAQRMYREVERQFPGSNWADEAKQFR